MFKKAHHYAAIHCFAILLTILVFLPLAFSGDLAKEANLRRLLDQVRPGMSSAQLEQFMGTPVRHTAQKATYVQKNGGTELVLTVRFVNQKLAEAIGDLKPPIAATLLLGDTEQFESLGPPSRLRDTNASSWIIGSPSEGTRWVLTPTGLVRSWSVTAPWSARAQLQTYEAIQSKWTLMGQGTLIRRKEK